MTNVLLFDPTRIKRATHIAEGDGQIIRINPFELMIAWREEFDAVATESANVLTRRPDAKIADVIEGAIYRVLNARYRHVNAGDRKDKLIASGVERYMDNVGVDGFCIYDAVTELMEIRAMLTPEALDKSMRGELD